MVVIDLMNPDEIEDPAPKVTIHTQVCNVCGKPTLGCCRDVPTTRVQIININGDVVDAEH